MKDERPMYEGDGQLREAPFDSESVPIRRLIEAFRAPEALRELFGGIAKRVRLGSRARKNELERYLAGATDAAEVERRTRQFERERKTLSLG